MGLRPTPPLSFYAVQACFKKHRTINKNWFKHIVVIQLFKPIMHAVYVQMGGYGPQPPHFFDLYKTTSSIILSAKTEAIWTLSEPVIKTSCVQMGGLRPPPNPPAFFLRRAGLLSKTSRH